MIFIEPLRIKRHRDKIVKTKKILKSLKNKSFKSMSIKNLIKQDFISESNSVNTVEEEKLVERKFQEVDSER